MALSFPLLLNVFTNFMFLLIALGPALSMMLLRERMPFLSTWLTMDVALGVLEWYLRGRSL